MNNKQRYIALSEQHVQLPVFYQPWWLNTVCQDWDIALVEKDQKLLAVFPFQTEKKLGLTIIRNPLLTPYLGPLFLYPAELPVHKRLHWEEQVFEALWQQLPPWDSIDIQCTPDFENYFLFHGKGISNNNKLTYRLQLSVSEEVLLRQLQSSHRKRIQQAAALYRVAEGIDFMEDFLKLHEQTFNRKKKKYVYKTGFIETLIRNSIETQKGRLWVALDAQQQVMGGVFTVWDEHAAYLLLSAVNVQEAHKGTICQLIWNAIVQAKAQGLAIFDFEGSMDKGIEHFFRHFGGNRQNYLRLSKDKSFLWRIKKYILG